VGGLVDWDTKVEQAIDLCLKINGLGKKTEVSFEFNGHQKSFEVRAFPNGWNGSLCPQIHNQWFIAPSGNIEMVDKVIAYLETLLKVVEKNESLHSVL